MTSFPRQMVGHPKPNPAADARLTLRTLGSARLEAHGSTGSSTELLGIGKPLALITYVACAPGREASRTRLVDLLWSDLDPEAARHALRQTLWHIRKHVVDNLLTATAESVALSRPLECDRDGLLAASQAREHEKVVDAYTGEFFPAFAAPGGAGFEYWTEVERSRLRQVFSAAADSLTRKWLNETRFHDAQGLARRLRDVNPHDEAAWRLLIEAYLSSGEQLSARIEADALEALAEHEEFELEGSTRAMIRAARGASQAVAASGAPGMAAEVMLVGREGEFSRLLHAWESAKHGRTARVCLLARAGFGKTRLLRDLAVRLRAQRARVAALRGNIAQRDLPYALASELAAALASLPGARSISPQSASVLVGLNPTLSTYFDASPQSASGDEGFRQRSLAIRELIQSICEEHPLALFIDDLHWSDETSHRLITGVASELGQLRLLLIFASRPDSRLTQQSDIAFEDVVELPPLTAPQVAQLIESLSALPDESWARSFPVLLAESADRSPLLVIETLQGLVDRSILERGPERWTCRQPERLVELLRTGSPIRARIMALERPERWLLAVAAASRHPLSLASISRVDERSRESIVASLTELERRGLLQRDGESWQVAHDEIADATTDAVGDEARNAARTAAGRSIVNTTVLDDRDARIAATLFSSSGATDELVSLFRRYAGQSYDRGDRRSLTRLARELVGSAAPDDQIRTLARRSPMRWRLGLFSHARLTAAIIAIVDLGIFGLGVLAKRPTEHPPDAVLGVFVPNDTGGFAIHAVEMREAEWPDSLPLRASRTTPPLIVPGFELVSVLGTASRSQRGAILSLSVNDTGVIDLFDVEPGMAPRRLTFSPGDDTSPSLSPDGRLLAFNTARWNPMSHYDVALLDLVTGDVRPLTHDDDTESRPLWSPDGTRLAFFRTPWGRGPSELCILSMSAEVTDCRSMNAQNAPLGWLDPWRLLTRLDSAGRRTLRVYRIEHDDFLPYVDWEVTEVSISPDGRWVICHCSFRPNEPVRTMVFPSDRPSRWRELDIPKSRGGAEIVWLRASRAMVSQRVNVARSWTSPTVGLPHQLQATVYDSLNRAVLAATARWHIADSSAGFIDSVSGLMYPKRQGSVTIQANVGDALRDQVTFSIRGPSTTSLWSDDWSDTSLTRWYRYGWPDSKVVTTPDGRHAFLNAGDGSYWSGAITRAAFPTDAGLAIDAIVSTPTPGRQWQAVGFDIVARNDTVRVAKARSRNAPPFVARDSILCSVAWPDENPAAEDSQRLLGLTNSVSALHVALDPRVTSGQWMTLRLQLLPDGRCGVALDGRPLALLPTPTAWSSRARLMIGGNSYQTEMLVGPIQVVGGVPNDIDWSKVRNK